MSGREKEAQRALALERRRSLSEDVRRAHSAAICRHLMELPVLQTAKVIFSYMAAGSEADLAGFHRWALEQGKTLAFPVSYPQGRMEAYVPEGPESWERGRYGILAPIPERSTRLDPQELDAVILPCVGFDAAGRRLGHGGGYYDRYLPQCPQALRVLVAFEAQRLDAVAVDLHDQRAQALVTELGAVLIPSGLDTDAPDKIY